MSANTIEDIATFIDENICELTYDSYGNRGNIFLDMMPSEPDNCICLVNTGGRQTRYEYGVELPYIDIFIRGNDREWVRNKSDEIYKFISNTSATINGTLYIKIKALKSPYFFKIDNKGNGRLIYKINIAIAKSLEEE